MKLDHVTYGLAGVYSVTPEGFEFIKLFFLELWETELKVFCQKAFILLCAGKDIMNDSKGGVLFFLLLIVQERWQKNQVIIAIGHDEAGR